VVDLSERRNGTRMTRIWRILADFICISLIKSVSPVAKKNQALFTEWWLYLSEGMARG
jgi:hypothetical protein